jgi:hypothetical protein
MNGIFSSLTEGDLRRIAALLLLIFFNTIFAVVGALMKGSFDPAAGGFDPRKFPEFVYKQILPYFVGFAFFEAFLHLLPPSTLVASFAGAPAPIIEGIDPIDPAAAWTWLDPAVLWGTYSAIIVDLVKRTFTNLSYLFGKGIIMAQAVANRA